MYEQEIRNLIQGIATSDNKGTNNLLCRVAKVDKEKRTIDVAVDSELSYFDIQLQAVEGFEKGLVLLPKVGSMVMIERIDNSDEWSCMMYSEVELVELRIDDCQLTMGKDGLGLKNNGKDLMNLLENLIDEIKKITVTTGVGASGVPINSAQFDFIKRDFKKVLKVV